MSAGTAIACEFGPAMVQGLAELGPFPAPGEDLSLELGLSIWLHETGVGVEEALEEMFRVRSTLIKVAGLDRSIEPVPLVGRADPQADLLTWASYMDGLLVRAVAASDVPAVELAARVAELH